MRMISFIDNDRDCEVYFHLNDLDEVEAIEVYPGVSGRIPVQKQVFSKPVPMVPNFVRIEAILAQPYLAPCRKQQESQHSQPIMPGSRVEPKKPCSSRASRGSENG